jgi:hypothetical protein
MASDYQIIKDMIQRAWEKRKISKDELETLVTDIEDIIMIFDK